MTTKCPFCGYHPYEYVDVGVGMVPVAVNCCTAGQLHFQYGWSVRKIKFWYWKEYWTDKIKGWLTSIVRNYTTDKFAIRTVRNGKVKIGGVWFTPDYQHDLERFEGKRFAFGRYKTGNKFEPFLYLWGTERLFRASNSEREAIADEEEKILCSVNPEKPDAGRCYLMHAWWRATK